MTTKTTWSALMLAASTLALSTLPAAAQEAATDDAATSDLAAEGTVDPLLLEEGAEGEAAAGTDVAADDAATEDTGADATLTAEGEATDDAMAEETDLAAEEGTLDAEGDATVTAEGGDAEAEGDATVTAEGEAADAAAGEEMDVAAEETTEAEGDATVTAESDEEAVAEEEQGTAVAEGQEADDAMQGADAQDGTELAADDAATAGAADATVTAEGETDAEAAEGAETGMAAADTAPAADATTTAEADPGMEGLEPTVTADAGAVASPPQQPGADMQAVLDKLAELGAQPISTLSVEEARSQPTPADAVMAVMEDRGIEMPAELAGILTRDITYPGADGTQIAARVYTPPEGEGPFPLIVYFHGGGWVIAGIDVYDASARALAAGANAVVVSATYRQAPGATFPAQHEDANAAYEWIVENSGEFNADVERLAVAGESAGGNLAMNVAIHARDAALVQPDHILSVYPIASDNMELPSYEAYAEAQPLSRDGMQWFFEHVFEDPSQASDPRVDLIARDDLAGLPPTTIVNAEIDPLQSEGEILAERLASAGVEVEQRTFDGVTHEFFSMGTVVPAAQEAMDFATANLREAFEASSAEGLMNDAATADAGTEASGVTEVEPTAADAPDAMATEGMAEDGAMEMEGEAQPMEGEEATPSE